MRVCLDTNVLVSAFATRGLCADVLRLVFAEHELLSGEVILEELQRVLEKRIRVPTRVTAAILELLHNQAVIVPRPALPAASGVRDSDDEWVIATALAGQADVLVTGDKDLLVLKSVAGMAIHDPRSFWQHVKKSEPY